MPNQQRIRNKSKFLDFTKPHYTVREVADYLGFSTKSIYDWNLLRPPRIEFVNLGTAEKPSYRVPVKEVLRLSGQTTTILSEKRRRTKKNV
jgi:hypothetical protein